MLEVKQIQGQITIDSYNTESAGSLTVYVRNTGSKQVNVTSIYVDGVSTTVTPATVAIGAVGPFSCTNTTTATWNYGASHTLKVVCADGTQVDQSIRKSSP